MAHLHTDLLAIAQLGHHHLLHGALEQAQIIWEGLYALAPREPAFALGLGLVRDRTGDKHAADELYARAAELDPGDPRAEVNRAELAIERGEITFARERLAAAEKKALARSDPEIAAKAASLRARVAGLPERARETDVRKAISRVSPASLARVPVQATPLLPVAPSPAPIARAALRPLRVRRSA
jgi:Flp pilus assembly protein TadD